ncbi:ABC transporter substrate-binding protein [Methylolobus aquaticus]|nr:ABC transporter substrate-binding protein [Methylolobus aquaticus]
MVVALLAMLVACHDNAGDRPELTWWVFDEPSGAFRAAAANCSERAAGRYTLRVEPLPADADQQREQLVRRLAARDTSIDLIGMDVIWTAEFAAAGWLLPWDAAAATRLAVGRLPITVESIRYGGRAWGAPFTSNAQLLWYRMDRVRSPPTTWDELLGTAEAAGGAGSVQLQGQRYEGLTVFFIALLASAGGAVLDEAVQGVALPEGPTRETLALMRRIATSPAADPSLDVMMEDQTRLAFETGRPWFMLNYPFVWPSALSHAPAVARQMAFAPWPGFDRTRPGRVALGGLNLAVGAYTRHPAVAFEAAECLTSAPHQLLAAVQGGLPPTLEDLYDLAEVRRRLPFADVLRDALHRAVLRPPTPLYHDVSLAISRTLHPMRAIDPQRDVQRLRRAVTRALRSEGLL